MAATVFAAAPALAESSSIDAYGGQAAVLGKPVHPHRAHTHGAGAGTGQESSTGAGGGAGSGGSAGPGAGAGLRAGSTGSGASAGGSRGAGAGGAVAGGGTNANLSSVAVQSPDALGGSLSLSALDVLLLLAILAGAVGVGVAIRRLGRFSA